MEELPEDASVTVEKTGRQWVVRVTGEGAPVEERFDSEDEAEDFALGHRTRLGLHVQPDMS